MSSKAFTEKFLWSAEGRYSNHPADRGRETNYGFSQPFLESVNEDPPNSKREAKALLDKYFWHQGKGMHPVAHWCYVDALFHHAPKSAAKCLQAGLGIKQDGVVGPVTRKAAQVIDVMEFCRLYHARRCRLFVAICRADNTQYVFLLGWLLRLGNLIPAAIKQ